MCPFLIGVALVLSPSAFAADPTWWRPDYLDRLPLRFQGSGTTPVGPSVVRWEAWDEKVPWVSPLPTEALERVLRESFATATQVAGGLGASSEVCDLDKKLYLVHLDGDTIDDHQRFGDWLEIEDRSRQQLRGLYDPTGRPPHDAVLSYAEPEIPRSVVLVHELGHYWYDRWCLSRASNVDSEAFAEAVANLWKTKKLFQ